MKKALLFAGLVLASVFGATNSNAQDNITVLALEIEDLPAGIFSIYCGGTHVGNGKPAFWSRRNSLKNDNLLIQMSKGSNIVEIQREDKPWDSFRIPFENFPMDGNPHTYKGTQQIDVGRAYTYSVTAIAASVKEVTVQSFHAPSEYIKGIYGNENSVSFTEPVLYMGVWSKNKQVFVTEGQPFDGNKTDFHFNSTYFFLSNAFPVVVRIYVAEKEALEEALRTVRNENKKTVKAIISAIGGSGAASLLSGLTTGGACVLLLAPAAGAVAGYYCYTRYAADDETDHLIVPDAREVASFEFDNLDSVTTQTKKCTGNILTEGLEIRLVVK